MDTTFNPLKLSALRKTWIIDIDGTILRHNGYLDGDDILLPGVAQFFQQLAVDDLVILLTARSESLRRETERALTKFGLRWDLLIMEVPTGERVVINDRKPSGLTTAHAVNIQRDQGLPANLFVIDPAL